MRLFHISENNNIKKFIPRPSSQLYIEIKGDVVFAISGKLLHNYLFPRDCPRISYYANPKSTQSDLRKFFSKTSADFVITVEEKWRDKIEHSVLYSYELPSETFHLLDECAGYYISYTNVIPIAKKNR